MPPHSLPRVIRLRLPDSTIITECFLDNVITSVGVFSTALRSSTRLRGDCSLDDGVTGNRGSTLSIIEIMQLDRLRTRTDANWAALLTNHSREQWGKVKISKR